MWSPCPLRQEVSPVLHEMCFSFYFSIISLNFGFSFQAWFSLQNCFDFLVLMNYQAHGLYRPVLQMNSGVALASPLECIRRKTLDIIMTSVWLYVMFLPSVRCNITIKPSITTGFLFSTHIPYRTFATTTDILWYQATGFPRLYSLASWLLTNVFPWVALQHILHMPQGDLLARIDTWLPTDI